MRSRVEWDSCHGYYSTEWIIYSTPARNSSTQNETQIVSLLEAARSAVDLDAWESIAFIWAWFEREIFGSVEFDEGKVFT